MITLPREEWSLRDLRRGTLVPQPSPQSIDKACEGLNLWFWRPISRTTVPSGLTWSPVLSAAVVNLLPAGKGARSLLTGHLGYVLALKSRLLEPAVAPGQDALKIGGRFMEGGGGRRGQSFSCPSPAIASSMWPAGEGHKPSVPSSRAGRRRRG